MRLEDLYPNAPHLRERLAGRFWSKVEIRGEDECWPWLASVVKKTKGAPGGYGRFGIDTAAAPKGYAHAHRVAFMLVHGEVPDELAVCHSCDNPPCCNPDHLWAGTKIENNADRDDKGRYGRAPDEAFQGERNGRAKLSEHDVRVMRWRYGLFIESLAREHGVSASSVQQLLERHTWAHVKPPYRHAARKAERRAA